MSVMGFDTLKKSKDLTAARFERRRPKRWPT
jgi:hypothetical protein